MGSVCRDLWLDVRYAARVFSKQPAFAAAAVLTLALGIGATTAIFSVVYGVLLKPLPFPEPERLVSLQQIAPHGAGTNHGLGTYLTYRENHQVFEGIGAWDPTEVSITGGGDPERVQGLLGSASTLPLLRVQPILGRAFGAEDDTPGAPRRVMLTHGYWLRRWAAGWSRGARSHGTTSASSGRSSSFPSRSRANIGESRRRQLASASAAVRRDFRGAKSSACPVTSATMD
jgi:hypothetical protein